MNFLSRLKENRLSSFLIIFIVYILATVAGVVAYRSLSYDWWLNLLIADVAQRLSPLFSALFLKMLLFMMPIGVFSL